MFKWVLQGLPWWHSGWGISLANAGVMGLIPGLGSRATESVSQNYWAQALEATAMRSPCTTMKTCPHSPQLEKAQSSPKINESESCSVVANSLRPHGLYSPWNSPVQNTGVGSLFLLQGIFPIQGLNPSLLHCRWIPYQLSHKGSPKSINK